MSKSKKKQTEAFKPLPIDVKLNALQVLATNNYNYSVTERQLNITRKTLKKWKDDLVPIVRSKQETETGAIHSAVSLVGVSVLQKIDEVNMAMFDRLLVLIPRETNIDKFSNLLNALKEFTASHPTLDPQNKQITIAEKIERITHINHE